MTLYRCSLPDDDVAGDGDIDDEKDNGCYRESCCIRADDD